MTTIRIGRPPRPHVLVRAARIFDRCTGYFVAFLVLASVRWLAMGEAAPMLLSLLLASVVCGPRRPKTSPRPAFGFGVGKAAPAVEHVSAGRRRLRRVWRLRRPMPGLIPIPPQGG